jgi:hypothetical protein
MESNCFICGIGKDYFDKVPHGFDTHVMQEHNLGKGLNTFDNILKFIRFLFSSSQLYVLPDASH